MKPKNLPPEKRNAETQALIDTFNQKVDFMDLNALDPIVEALG